MRIFINSLRRILPNEVDEEGGFKGWMKYAKNEQIWDGIVEKFFKELKPSDDGSPKKKNEKNVSSERYSWCLDELFREPESEQ